ncbi:transcription factor with AP2 domain, putative [Babesia caballi]|uniref:Transcription factor with AP2 domain, putative n=1 Tax=Babesia caballi TaxID=5871 RepID=A0AAV4LNJ6_BABCB|nr:transcription factor with AP2 domain, putative [Babesia caballi]
MGDATQVETPYTSADSGNEVASVSPMDSGERYGYGSDAPELPGASGNRMEHPDARDSVDYGLSELGGPQPFDEGGAAFSSLDASSHQGSFTEQGWSGTGYMNLTQEGLHFNGDVGHDSHMGFGSQSFDLSSTMVGSFGGVVGENAMQSGEGNRMHPKVMNMSQRDMMQPHGMSMKMDDGSMSGDAPRRAIAKGRKNKDEANELVRRAKLLPKVMGVRYDANHQYWVATWYQNRKRMDRYFSVGRFGFEEARMLAIDCRKTAGKSLQGKSYDRPQYPNKEPTVKPRTSFGTGLLTFIHVFADEAGVDKTTEYYGGSEISKKTKDFNRLNVSKVALNYILSDLCNNCLPSILENNHMPGELYIHCYNKISDHLQLIITANQSEEIEKYLHLFQLCIQNRVLPSALQVQEQRAMITTLCQM